MSEAGENGGAGGPPRRILLRDYARQYGADERTVKRWRARGVENSDPLPLEDPEKMMGWWQRNMKQRVPPGITEAVIQWRKAGHSSAGVLEAVADELPLEPVGSKPVAAPDERQKKVDQPVSEEEMGLERTYRRLQEMEVRLSRIATDPGQAKAWHDTVARMTTTAQKLREEMERGRILIPRERAEVLIHEFHVPVEREVRLLVRTMGEALGLPVTPAMEQTWNAECDRIFARFGEEVFRAS